MLAVRAKKITAESDAEMFENQSCICSSYTSTLNCCFFALDTCMQLMKHVD